MIPLTVYNISMVPKAKRFHINEIIIGINTVVYLIEMYYADNIPALFNLFGLNTVKPPVFNTTTGAMQLFTYLTYMFFHGNLLHLLPNMWILYVVGKVVERQLGSIKYALLYLSGGVFSGVVVTSLKISSCGIYIGASAAISAVIGAFVVFNYRAKLFVLFPVLILPIFLEVPSVVFVIFWCVIQMVFGIAKSMATQLVPTSTEYWSHVAGFLIGLSLSKSAVKPGRFSAGI